MAITLHRCSNEWVKLSGHPCWRVQKALDEAGNAQPDEADWNVGGYANNSVQRVAVRVV